MNVSQRARLARKRGGGMDALSPREREVLELLVTHACTKRVADELRLRDRTVSHHREVIAAAFGGSMLRAAYALGREDAAMRRGARDAEVWRVGGVEVRVQ